MNSDIRLAGRPVFSVITPVFNGEKYIRETINSVLDAAQGFSFEYLVVDDGSTDATYQFLLEFSDSIKIIRQQNFGESSAVNRGLEESSGELILILSADDPLFTNKIFTGAEEYFNQNHEVVAWYPNWRKIDELGNLIEEVVPLDFTLERVLGFGMCLPGPGTLFRASAARKIQGRSTQIKFASDYEFWLRLNQIGKLVHRDQLVAQWRQHDGSTTVTSRGKAMGEERIQLVDSFIRKNSVEEELARMARASSRYFAAALGVFDKNVKSRKLILESISINQGLPEVAKFRVVVFALLHPISFYIVRLIARLSKKFSKKIYDI
jgi:glycosyltransferase involved in cell wall biosynthesis